MCILCCCLNDNIYIKIFTNVSWRMNRFNNNSHDYPALLLLKLVILPSN